MIAGVAWSANPGDKGISYKDNTAYVISVTKSATERTEAWVLREGSQSDWDYIEAGFRSNVVCLAIRMKDGYGIVWFRGYMQVGWQTMDTGWRQTTDTLPENVHYDVEYYAFEGTGFKKRGTKYTKYMDASKEYVEHLIWNMSNAEYIEGQEGR